MDKEFIEHLIIVLLKYFKSLNNKIINDIENNTEDDNIYLHPYCQLIYYLCCNKNVVLRVYLEKNTIK